jgi:hypothetical protein
VRSYAVADVFYWQRYEDVGDRSYWTRNVVEVGQGGVGVNRVLQSSDITGWCGPVERMTSGFKLPFHSSPPPAYPNFGIGIGDLRGGFALGGFSQSDPKRGRAQAYAWQIVMPFWTVTPVFAVLPVVRATRWLRRRRRVGAGRCPSCGYDLRATPARCPECGNTPTRTSATE